MAFFKSDILSNTLLPKFIRCVEKQLEQLNENGIEDINIFSAHVNSNGRFPYFDQAPISELSKYFNNKLAIPGTSSQVERGFIEYQQAQVIFKFKVSKNELQNFLDEISRLRDDLKLRELTPRSLSPTLSDN